MKLRLLVSQLLLSLLVVFAVSAAEEPGRLEGVVGAAGGKTVSAGNGAASMRVPRFAKGHHMELLQTKNPFRLARANGSVVYPL